MIIGIVGSEESKFTTAGKEDAIKRIIELICDPTVDEVVSGECHLGGVDIWTRECAERLGKKFTAFAPKTLSWENGYKPRNLQIARRSDICVCITVRHLPRAYTGMTFDSCYHCHTDTHVKSGGCWTMKQAAKMGKRTKLIVVENEEEEHSACA